MTDDSRRSSTWPEAVMVLGTIVAILLFLGWIAWLVLA